MIKAAEQTAASPTTTAAAPAQSSSRKKALLVVPVVALLLAAWFFLLGPGTASEPEDVAEPEHGEVLDLEPITLNLADGRLLKVGLSLHMVAEPAEEEATGAIALDEAVAFLGEHTYAQLIDPAARQAAKDELGRRVAERYHQDVLELYFTEFVMQ